MGRFARRTKAGSYAPYYLGMAIEELFTKLLPLEGIARYTGILLAPAEGFALWPRFVHLCCFF